MASGSKAQYISLGPRGGPGGGGKQASLSEEEEEEEEEVKGEVERLRARLRLRSPDRVNIESGTKGKTKQADLLLSVSKIHNGLRRRMKGYRLSWNAIIQTAASVEYLISEILRMSIVRLTKNYLGQESHHHGRLTSAYIAAWLRDNEDIGPMYRDAVIQGGGVQQQIQAYLKLPSEIRKLVKAKDVRNVSDEIIAEAKKYRYPRKKAPAGGKKKASSGGKGGGKKKAPSGGKR